METGKNLAPCFEYLKIEKCKESSKESADYSENDGWNEGKYVD